VRPGAPASRGLNRRQVRRCVLRCSVFGVWVPGTTQRPVQARMGPWVPWLGASRAEAECSRPAVSGDMSARARATAEAARAETDLRPRASGRDGPEHPAAVPEVPRHGPRRELSSTAVFNCGFIRTGCKVASNRGRANAMEHRSQRRTGDGVRARARRPRHVLAGPAANVGPG